MGPLFLGSVKKMSRCDTWECGSLVGLVNGWTWWSTLLDVSSSLNDSVIQKDWQTGIMCWINTELILLMPQKVTRRVVKTSLLFLFSTKGKALGWPKWGIGANTAQVRMCTLTLNYLCLIVFFLCGEFYISKLSKYWSREFRPVANYSSYCGRTKWPPLSTKLLWDRGLQEQNRRFSLLSDMK